MTLPEVQTLLDGITVGGHKISDQNMALHQAEAWRHLFRRIDAGTFRFSRATALELHAIAGKGEALEWGRFRSGQVMISGSDHIPPAATDLDAEWQAMESAMQAIADIDDRAITAFLRMARAPFFWDVNKRLGRFMMNGILLEAGYPIINVPARRQQEFNRLMLDYYATADPTRMNAFLRSCLHPKIIGNFTA